MKFLIGTFTKLQEAIIIISFTISVYLFVHPSVCPTFYMEQLGSHWTDFHGISYKILLNSVKKIQGSLKSDKNNGYFTFMIIYLNSS